MNASHTALSTSLLALSATLHAQTLVRSVNGPAALARFGATSLFIPDQNGDGVTDVLVGAPGFNSSRGAVYCVAGAYLMTGTGASTLWSLAPKANASDAVRAVADLDGDGVGEYMVGAPDFFTNTFPSGWSFRGLVRIYSGATGMQLTSIAGSSTDRLVDGPGCSSGDLNNDGLRELVVTGSLSDAGGADSGVLRCYRIFLVAPVIYCVAKVNSLGCSPSISSSGAASGTSASPFLVNCSQLINQKQGLLFYSHAPAVAPFQSGTLCVSGFIARTPIQDSGGSLTGNDCSGTFSFDFNARIASGIDPTLRLGAEVCAQYWSRDPATPSTTSLSNALQFVVNP